MECATDAPTGRPDPVGPDEPLFEGVHTRRLGTFPQICGPVFLTSALLIVTFVALGVEYQDAMTPLKTAVQDWVEFELGRFYKVSGAIFPAVYPWLAFGRHAHVRLGGQAERPQGGAAHLIRHALQRGHGDRAAVMGRGRAAQPLPGSALLGGGHRGRRRAGRVVPRHHTPAGTPARSAPAPPRAARRPCRRCPCVCLAHCSSSRVRFCE